MKLSNIKLPDLSFYQIIIPKKDRVFFNLYLRWLYLLYIRSFNIKKTHTNSFNLLYKAVSHSWGINNLLGNLQKEFIARNISLSILFEPVDGFYWFYKKMYKLDFASSSPMLLQLFAPVSRMIAILNNQKPLFYQPFSNLIFIYISLYLIKNQKIMKVLDASLININIQSLIKQQPFHFKEALQVISIIKGIKFKLIVSFYLGFYKVLLKKIMNNTSKNINFLDYVNSILYGLYYIITIKDNTKGLNKI